MTTTEQTIPLWVKMINNFKVSDIVPPFRTLVTVKINDKLPRVFEMLSTYNVSSAIVIDNENNIVGFVSVHDILVYFLNVLGKGKELITAESLNKISERSPDLQDIEIGNLVNLSGINTLYAVNKDALMVDVMETFAKEVHGLAVVEGGKVINVVSQTDIIRCYALHGASLGQELRVPISKLNIMNVDLLKVNTTTPTTETLTSMFNCNVRAVPVLDEQSRLVATFSISDLKKLNPNNMGNIVTDVISFLNSVYGVPRPPVYVHPNETLEHVLLKLIVHGIHRIWVVDENLKILGVISNTDIITFFLNALKKYKKSDV